MNRLMLLLLMGSFMGSASAASLGTANLTKVYPRIFTPNGDHANDKVRFEVDNPEQLPVGGSIYDLSGSHVVDLNEGTDVVLWDGKDSNGSTVPSGVYLYELEYQGKHATGSVVVAR